MTDTHTTERLPLNFLFDDRALAPEMQESAPLDAALADIARRVPDPRKPQTFTDDMQRFAAGADDIMAQLTTTTDELRLALSENALLRGRNADLTEHLARLNAYWEEQYERVCAERQRMTRLYVAITTRLDAIAEFTTATREAARREAFAPEERPARPEGIEVVERDPEPANDAQSLLQRLASTRH